MQAILLKAKCPQPTGVTVSNGSVQKIGNSATKSGRVVSLFSVPCPNCNKERLIKRQQHALNHQDKPCKKCSNRNNHPQGQFNGIRISWWNKYKLGASYRNIVWNLDIEDAVEILNKQDFKCALTGLDLVCVGDLTNINASLDRLDNSKGYIKENVQFVHKDVNMMRGVLSLERLTELCDLISNNKVKW